MKLGISLIEVKYGKFYKDVVKRLLNNGITNIHIDFCEQNFTGRKILPFNKIEYIRKIKKKDTLIDFHVMGFHECKKGNLEKLAKKISNYKFKKSNFYFHLKAFKNYSNILNFLEKLTKFKLNPGLVIEINQKFNKKFELLLKKKFFNTYLIMGYKEGAGGREFNSQCYQNSKKLKKILLKYNIKKSNIQFDGGLNIKNIKEFKKLKFDQVNGWSIIKSKKISEVIEKHNCLKKFLS